MIVYYSCTVQSESSKVCHPILWCGCLGGSVTTLLFMSSNACGSGVVGETSYKYSQKCRNLVFTQPAGSLSLCVCTPQLPGEQDGHIRESWQWLTLRPHIIKSKMSKSLKRCHAETVYAGSRSINRMSPPNSILVGVGINGATNAQILQLNCIVAHFKCCILCFFLVKLVWQN